MTVSVIWHCESVFLTGFKKEVTKNGIVFERELKKSLPHINVKQVKINRSGCVILSPSAPEDFSRLMKEDWSKHVSLGSNIKVSVHKDKKVEYKVVIKGVDPELDDATLKTELEERNNLKVTNLARLLHKPTGGKTWKIIVSLENEETQKRVLRDNVFFGLFGSHMCACS